MKHIYCLFFLFFCSVFMLNGQQITIDSLKTELASSKTDEDKIERLSRIGLAYFENQIYLDSAFFYTEKALQLAKDTDNKPEIARSLFNLGAIESGTKNHETSIDYFEEVILLLDELGMKNPQSSAFNNIGANYFELKDYENARQSYLQGLAIAKSTQDTVCISIVYMNIGEIDFTLKKYSDAIVNFEKSLNLISQSSFNPPTAHLFYARALFAEGKISIAEEQGLEALKISKEENDLKYISEASQLLSDIYAEKEEFKNAFKYHKMFSVYKDSLNEAGETNEIEKLKLNFELSKNKEALANISQQNKYRNIIYILAVIGIVLLVVLVSRQRKISKMTSNIHEIQRRLVEPELNAREKRMRDKNATGFDAAIEQDKDIIQ